MFRKVLLLITYPMLFQIIASEELSKTVPVFIVDNERALPNLMPSKSPFSTLNKMQFGDVVRDALRKSDRIIIFVEDILSAEDISSRDKFGSPYYLLRQGMIDGSVKHYPSVDDPYFVLQNLLPKTEYNTFHLDSKTSKLRLYDSNIRNIYIFFRDSANMSRIEALRDHDLIMREVNYVVKQRADGPVVAFYTGKVNRNSVNRPKDSPFAWETRRDAIWCRHPKAILAVEGLRIIHKNKPVALPPTDLGEVACTYYWNRDEDPDEVTIAMPLTTYTLQCRFTFSDVTWTLERCYLRPDSGAAGLRGGEGSHVDFRRTLRYAKTLQYNEPFDFRGSDGDGVVVNKITVEVLNQPGQLKFSLTQGEEKKPDKESAGTGEKASDEASAGTDEKSSDKDSAAKDDTKEPSKDKGGASDTPTTPPSDKSTKDQEEFFFTEPLLTCFFVSSILLSILFYGFSSLAAVNSNSRYDDPKGKPLMFAES